jgi:hypothetical protein
VAILMQNDSRAILNIPFEINVIALKKQLRIKPGTESEKKIYELIKAAQKIGQPKALYRVAYINSRDNNTISLDGVTFSSAAMCKNLKEVNRVFVYVTTCGVEVLEIASSITDLIEKYWMSQIRIELLNAGREYLIAEIQRIYQTDNLSTMNPGSGDADIWPIEQQRALFSLLGNVQGMIGVELMPSYLMHPDMSVSGIFFETENNYSNCQLCQRKNCTSRKAPFNDKLWQQINI